MDTLGDVIRRQRQVHELSLRQLAQLTGISNPYLSQIERGLREPSSMVVDAIADALDLTTERLYEAAGIRPEEDEAAWAGARWRRPSWRTRSSSPRSATRCSRPTPRS